MGAVLKVHHLAVISAGFFNTLAAAPTQVLHAWDDARDPVMYFKVRHFARAGAPLERQLPVTRLESINSVHEQQLFALAAVRAGMGGPGMLRDLTLLQLGQTAQVPAPRQEALHDMLTRLAALPKTRVRMPGGVQHLLADPLDKLLQQTDELNSALVRVNLTAYVPQGTDLTHPNAQVLALDEHDVRANGGRLNILVQRERVAELLPTDPALAFSHLAATARRGVQTYADYSGADALPRAQLFMRGGGAYLVTNSAAALASALEQKTMPATARLVTLPTRALS
jgi:hypothetical protein